jgi:hypothetical protein
MSKYFFFLYFIMNFLRSMCTPATVYFVVSIISILAMVFQNMGNPDKLCVGSYACNIGNNAVVFAVEFLYVLFWTWMLDLICKSGHKNIAWFLVLLPFLLMFVGLGILMLNHGVYAI